MWWVDKKSACKYRYFLFLDGGFFPKTSRSVSERGDSAGSSLYPRLNYDVRDTNLAIFPPLLRVNRNLILLLVLAGGFLGEQNSGQLLLTLCIICGKVSVLAFEIQQIFWNQINSSRVILHQMHMVTIRYSTL